MLGASIVCMKMMRQSEMISSPPAERSSVVCGGKRGVHARVSPPHPPGCSQELQRGEGRGKREEPAAVQSVAWQEER